ncbi:MAG TPA: hypothetical protein VHT24_09410 [Pseudacidobacterium sp.]|nr:hypothetical protein [Pseudacidobacterium sp.]
MLANFRSWWKPSFFLATLLVALFSIKPAFAQTGILHNSDVSVSAFGQFTNSTSGNGISVDPTRSVGGQAAFRHVYHTWLGYEALYGYTRFTDRYSSVVFPVQHNVHEFGGSYLMSGPNVLGIQPFGLAGFSALLYAPSLNGGQNASSQGRPAFTFGLGANFPLLTSHFGARVQYRGLYHPTPDYGQAQYKTSTWRLTSEPAAGLYFKF